ncbi:malonyl CoA-acyl carrier protein transacylase [Paenibacillus sp. CF095]|uniref:ACP S-malonyltransferase n=1 Tax=Paenibacillus sp. CF095 TaxID=1881033 RepID=UPI0008918FFE|nr:ACP S-malonyltransferase [Paenibacillus sp. CF095]SDD52066.1 malonyl CoA-acyl carrier protein transacylase [Paenibacillus sp. CF095]
MKTYIFPGQGSQAKGMGEGLFEAFPDLVAKADAILGYSIKRLCLDNPEGKLRYTQYTQPALYVVNALTYFKKLRDGAPKPDFLAGHSLGEYNAILAAGGFDFETGLMLVKKRGELMSQASGGAMAAVVGLTEGEIKGVLVNNRLTEIDIANLNTTTQIVISGNKDDIDRAKLYFEREGADYIPLNVSAAFHSRHMQEAKEEFEQYLREFSYSELTIPVISNVTARPYNPAEIVPNLAEQLRSSVRWTDSIRYLIRQGGMEFEETGPGSVLTKIIAKIKVEPPVNQQRGSVGVRVTKSIDRKEEDTEGQAEFKRKIDTAFQKTTEWNQVYPIGTKVTCKGYEDVLITRTEAQVLFGHRAAVYVEGYNGYFALDEIRVV